MKDDGFSVKCVAIQKNSQMHSHINTNKNIRTQQDFNLRGQSRIGLHMHYRMHLHIANVCK